MTSTNSELPTPAQAPNKIRQETIKSHYRRRDIPFTLFYPDMDQIFQAINPNRNKGYTQTASDPERQQDREILDPEREHRDKEFPEKEDHNDINPNRNVPEEDNDLNDEDGAIIEEPTRELDDPYRPGHADKENIPPIQKEF